MPTKDIYECADHREFLRAQIEQDGAAGGVRSLARKAGFKSAGFLTMLVKGERRLSPRSAALLAEALKLKGRRRTLFLAFSRLDASKTESERHAAREEILKLKSYHPEFRMQATQYSFLGVWYYPVLYTLLQGHNAETTPEYFAERLGRGVKAADVERALKDLAALGLIERDECGAWRPRHVALSTPEDVQSVAVSQYHRNALKLAESALALPLDEREFNGLTVAVPRRHLPLVKAKIRALRTELNELLSRENEPADIYQVNLQVFPLTRGVERK